MLCSFSPMCIQSVFIHYQVFGIIRSLEKCSHSIWHYFDGLYTNVHKILFMPIASSINELTSCMYIVNYDYYQPCHVSSVFVRILNIFFCLFVASAKIIIIIIINVHFYIYPVKWLKNVLRAHFYANKRHAKCLIWTLTKAF